MALTKNLANCTPKEFLIQTNKIRKSAERWLKATDIMNIRRNVPKLEIPPAASSEETNEIIRKHKIKLQNQAFKNFSDILDAVMENHPDETLEVLALACFVEPKDVNEHKITEYLANVTEILNDEAVISFFTSLMRLGQIDTLGR